ncbi:MAG: GNAT family N-acetyltransferase [Planctomycetaceae bacterium]|nr:GNAT family N-acetyltransferase [Planctomycetaceae bacterium]
MTDLKGAAVSGYDAAMMPVNQHPTAAASKDIDEFRIRAMSGAELPLALEWAAREGWNPGLHDAACFYAADAGGFLVGELAGEPIGCISAVKYGTNFGFIGLYIVRPEFRGRGFGIQLWRAAMERLAGRNVGLDGVVAQQANYARSGFRLAYRNVRYQGRVGGGAEGSGLPSGLVAASTMPLGAVAAYDRAIFPAPRDAFLKAWFEQPDAGGFAAVDGGRLRGYVVVRRCLEGWKIGPLAADDPSMARRLYEAAAMHAGAGATLFLDVPEANAAAPRFAAELGMTPAFETARMYTGDPPAVALAKLFGVTSFELG